MSPLLGRIATKVKVNGRAAVGRNFYPHTHTNGDPHGDPHTHGRPGKRSTPVRSTPHRALSYLSEHCIPVSSADTRRHLRSANRHLGYLTYRVSG